MIDPKGGIANIKKKRPVPNYCFDERTQEPVVAVFQRKVKVKVKVSDYNSKAGKLSL